MKYRRVVCGNLFRLIYFSYRNRRKRECWNKFQICHIFFLFLWREWEIMPVSVCSVARCVCWSVLSSCHFLFLPILNTLVFSIPGPARLCGSRAVAWVAKQKRSWGLGHSGFHRRLRWICSVVSSLSCASAVSGKWYVIDFHMLTKSIVVALHIIRSAVATGFGIGSPTSRTRSSSRGGLMLLLGFSCGFGSPPHPLYHLGVETVCFFNWHIMIIASRDKI